MNKKQFLQWILRIIAAIIMLQTLYFKFTPEPESVRLFTKLGMEPWGRIGTGIMELIASILLLIPATTVFGALLGIGLMSGAIFFHLTKLGINFEGSTLLFTYAIIVFISCAVLVLMNKQKIIAFAKNKIHV
jgi:uncharacterized membrane protein YphA (DoxX/SURF4 family)